MEEERVEVFVERSFEAAHALSKLPSEHKCHGVHGHHYKIRVYCEGPVHPEDGFVIDYGDIKKWLDPLIKVVDHTMLNDSLELEQPSTENLARWFWDKLSPRLSQVLDRIEIRETEANGCIYSRRRRD